MPWRGPAKPGEFPTLGWDVAEWIEEFCVIPDRAEAGNPYLLTEEMRNFLLWHYRIDPIKADPKAPALAFAYRRSQLVRPQKWGKALDLSTPIPTPSGWSTMGDLVVGDSVFDERGEPCTVLAKSPVWTDTDCYRITFSDHATIVASGDHLWAVDERTKSSTYIPKVLATRDMVGALTDSHGARRFRVATAGPLRTPEIDLPVDPYVLGAWLGDGETSGGRVHGIDQQVFDEIEAAGYAMRQQTYKRWGIYKLKVDLVAAGVLNNKHIPAAYLRSSEKQRLALLQGLMDTDGHCDGRAYCEFVTVLPALRDGVRELLYSLGIKHTCSLGETKLYGRVTGPKWRICFAGRSDLPVFRLSRKLARMMEPGRNHAQYQHRRIFAIDPIDPVPTVCITVDSPSSLYLAGREMIPTHNSPFVSAIICAEADEVDAPVQFDGWSADGEPVGRPWVTPWVQVTAASGDQTANTYRALKPMIDLGPLADRIPDTGETRINLPGGGFIEPVTAAARTRLGQRVTFVTQDETGTWFKTNDMHGLADTQRRNLGGMGGRAIETTNAWDPAEISVAQRTFEFTGKDVYRDYPTPEKGDFKKSRDRRRIIRFAYRDSLREKGGWVDLDRIDAEAVELIEIGEAAQAERFYGNRVVAGGGPAFDLARWNDLANHGLAIGKKEWITLGFDGARYFDATALVATHVESGFQWPLGIWESDPNDPDWEVPVDEVDQAIDGAFSYWRVALAYFDPPYWDDAISAWSGRHGDKIIKRWPTLRYREMNTLLKKYRQAMMAGELLHDGDETFARHIGNSRRRSHQGLVDDEGKPVWTISKDRPESPLKIDAAMAGCLSWAARGAALADGVLNKTKGAQAVFL